MNWRSFLDGKANKFLMCDFSCALINSPFDRHKWLANGQKMNRNGSEKNEHTRRDN